MITVPSSGTIDVSLGTAGANDTSDFHDALGSIAWEKRDTAGALITVAGATFTVSPNPLVGGVGTYTVIDNSTNDIDPAIGQIQIANIKVGQTYTITETVAPAGYALDSTPRTVTVPSSGTLDVSIGTAGQNDTSDFHDPLGSIAWEKRDTAGALITVAGATFTVSPNPLVGGVGTYTVVDNGTNDIDPAIGQIKIANIKVGATYTITETVAPAGYALDSTPRMITVPSSGVLDVSLGTAGINDTSDFHDALGSIAWEKRDTAGTLITVAGATFTVSPNPLVGGVGTYTVIDNSTNDTDPAIGQIKIANIKVGQTYTITETVAPSGYALDSTPRMITVPSSGVLDVSLG